MHCSMNNILFLSRPWFSVDLIDPSLQNSSCENDPHTCGFSLATWINLLILILFSIFLCWSLVSLFLIWNATLRTKLNGLILKPVKAYNFIIINIFIVHFLHNQRFWIAQLQAQLNSWYRYRAPTSKTQLNCHLFYG